VIPPPTQRRERCLSPCAPLCAPLCVALCVEARELNHPSLPSQREDGETERRRGLHSEPQQQRRPPS
jgi:hypothetical protein